MIFNVLTIFPQMFPGPLGVSNLGSALKKGLWTLNVFDIRAFANNKHNTVDDTPYGGGPGMLLRADVLGRCIDEVLSLHPNTKLMFTSPRGVSFTQDIARQTMNFDNITLLCGRFEGIDERVVDFYKLQEVSIGDYVLSGGELAAMVIIDTCVRMVPGVIGNAESLKQESMEGSLEYPQYTRPASWKGMEVPEVLLTGNHGEIEKWRRNASLSITAARRPDLLKDRYSENDVD
ncbi:tRNA (guanosine(37)-N1)-methyltransferase TrmD [Anaplasma phagocytophilum]|uniref:tRNA (guanine-N(1)-)-methyltransferase n=3 Tax=Anaplasma phagocytophilum TaxID=948 RepID=A0A0F3PPU5_ANAPH|nr:tRNA (guanosine(37)-N1)-methyltransferase TrmD [Anaplasma phagocytophilum]EOA62703.1 tRNA (guanine-N(1)-)-methyltransferase [Anaplasma phagocytophilum str. CRT38]KDB56381.1 tRNA (guanine-N1)-methyltransferase [Anaplasma phagocytophilum str. CRT35]KJV82012.1 tRNA (guanine(37)-N(1))-methyltransferase [Anaplasma phagocytophilum str. CRT53-1]